MQEKFSKADLYVLRDQIKASSDIVETFYMINDLIHKFHLSWSKELLDSWTDNMRNDLYELMYNLAYKSYHMIETSHNTELSESDKAILVKEFDEWLD